MLTIPLLSADGALASAILRFFGVSRRDLNFACCTLGLFDGIALALGYSLRGLLAGRMGPPPEWILLACSIVLSIFVAKTIPTRPRVAIAVLSVLFSIDNLIAGMQIDTIGAAARSTLLGAVCTMLLCRLAFECADVVAVRIRRRVLFGLAAVSLAINLLFL
ncbi:MAG TPA: hypothetical protein VM715_10885 [Candidatus Acidoferrum sp.]|jgi:hypothetical protein|nr:hypothetical protein [Candidatus Acidoferrum sp.]